MSGATQTTGAPVIKIDGTTMSAAGSDALVDLRVSLTTGAAGYAELHFDRSVTLSPAPKVGSMLVVLAVEGDADAAEVFSGEVMSVGIDISKRSDRIIIGAYDSSYLLGSRTDTTSHLNTTFGDLVTKIASDAGLSSTVDGQVASQAFPHIQQTGTPHQFLTDLTRAFGCEWFVSGEKLTVRRRASSGPVAKLSGATDLRRFVGRVNGMEQASTVDVRGWDPRQQDFVSHSVTSRGVMTGHDVPIATSAVKGTLPGKNAVAWPIAISTSEEAKRIAEGITARLESAKLTGRGETDVNSKLTPGAIVEIDDLDPQWNGKYYLTGVEHVFGRSQPFITRFTFGALDPTTLVDLFGPQAATSRERLTQGVSIGEVTDTNDPDRLARVKVRLPVMSGDNVSHWARVISPGAGPERGSLTLPEIGDEVAIAFENGDVQRPYVLGGLWNGKNKAPSIPQGVKDGKVMSRSMTSRTGHLLEFSDGDSAEELFVRVSTGDTKTVLTLGQTKIEITSDKKPIKVTNGKATIELTDSGDITVSGQKITIDAKGDLALSGANVKIDAKQGLTMSGAQLEAKGKATTKIDGGTVTEIKGGMVRIN
jgi:phage baseplate assembly protein gpV